jgi:hypothetical protein
VFVTYCFVEFTKRFSSPPEMNLGVHPAGTMVSLPLAFVVPIQNLVQMLARGPPLDAKLLQILISAQREIYVRSSKRR